MDAIETTPFHVHCEWAEFGVALAGEGAAVILVDVLSFSTCVDVALAHGAAILPFPYRDAGAADFARAQEAFLASPRGGGTFSLSPASLTKITPGLRLVLPSPNGSALTRLARAPVVLCACLRNARAVAGYVNRLDMPVMVVPCGERWPNGTLRPAAEDWIGAGAVIAHLRGRCSPEAEAAVAAFAYVEARLHEAIRDCVSGIELTALGFAYDVRLAAELDASTCVPRYLPFEYRNAGEAT